MSIEPEFVIFPQDLTVASASLTLQGLAYDLLVYP